MDEIEIDEMIAETRGVIDGINTQIEAIGSSGAYLPPSNPHLVRGKDGLYLTTPLLVAKAECLSAVAALLVAKAAISEERSQENTSTDDR